MLLQKVIFGSLYGGGFASRREPESMGFCEVGVWGLGFRVITLEKDSLGFRV